MGPDYKWTDSDVIWATGPDVLTTVYHDYKKKLVVENICVVPRKLCDAYFTHRATGMWRGDKDTQDFNTTTNTQGDLSNVVE